MPAEAGFVLIPPPEDPPRDTRRIAAQSVLNGLTVANINPAVVEEMALPYDAAGVVVVSVEGIAVRTRLRPGDILRRINGVAIDNTGDVAKVAAIRSNGYEIGFERNGQRALIRLRNR